ncbi:hypothetical protein M569_02279, partial [Genlisea aurea]
LKVSKKSRRKKRNKTMKENRDIEGPSEDMGNLKNDNVNSIPDELFHRSTLADDDGDIERPSEDNGDTENDNANSIPEESVDGRSLENDMVNNDDRAEADEKDTADHDGRFDIETDKSSGDEQLVLSNEVDFKVSSLVSALANHTVIQKLCWLLSNYRSNSTITNHYIISMLRRVCDDLDLSPMLYQLSFLTVFYDILEEQKSRPCGEYENIVKFLTTLIRRMLRILKSYPLLFVEILFRKTTKECRYINCGSMQNEIKDIRNATLEGNGNANVGGSSARLHRSIADALGDDDFEVSFQD